MWQVDGACGEGGGQLLRTALALAAATGTALQIDNVRAGRRGRPPSALGCGARGGGAVRQPVDLDQ